MFDIKPERPKIFIIDNYDSFVYNLAHYLEEMNCEVTIKRNDQFSMEEVEAFDKILLSPGPGIPEDAGFMKKTIRHFASSKSILGVCLGHQAIAEVFGGTLKNLDHALHGISTKATIISKIEPLFKNFPSEFEVGHYHSWVVSKDRFPKQLEITSIDEQGEIMSFRHRTFDLCAVQFHPESILTPLGKQIIKNWIEH